jgi:protein phosphatase
MKIPEAALVLLIGASGSGKSTFARRHFLRTEIVSSDACRALVCDDEADQDATADAFQVLGLIVETRLKRGRRTVIDATNVQPWARDKLLALTRRYARPAVAIVLDTPEATCVLRCDGRQRAVAADVIAQQVRDLRRSLAKLSNEGFAEVHIVESDQILTEKLTLP